MSAADFMLLYKRCERVAKLSVIIYADKIKIGNINTFVVSSRAVVIAEENDLVVRYSVVTAIAVKRTRCNREKPQPLRYKMRDAFFCPDRI